MWIKTETTYIENGIEHCSNDHISTTWYEYDNHSVLAIKDYCYEINSDRNNTRHYYCKK